MAWALFALSATSVISLACWCIATRILNKQLDIERQKATEAAIEANGWRDRMAWQQADINKILGSPKESIEVATKAMVYERDDLKERFTATKRYCDFLEDRLTKIKMMTNTDELLEGEDDPESPIVDKTVPR